MLNLENLINCKRICSFSLRDNFLWVIYFVLACLIIKFSFYTFIKKEKEKKKPLYTLYLWVSTLGAGKHILCSEIAT